MLPLSDGISSRRFPIVNVAIILGLWFLYQLVEANFGLVSASANGGGVAFFAYVGGFLFGVIVASGLGRARTLAPQGRRLRSEFA